jgi:hypothetical protein
MQKDHFCRLVKCGFYVTILYIYRVKNAVKTAIRICSFNFMGKIVLIINIIGLAGNFAGTLMMFKANPKVTIGGGFHSFEDGIEMQTGKRTKLFRRGMLILSFGFLLQMISLIISILKESFP